MPKHTKTQIWIHAVWGTYRREPVLTKSIGEKLYLFIEQKLKEIEINKENLFIRPEHVHLLFSLPADKTLAEIMQSIKGSSSHWINKDKLCPNKFGWARGYGAFSVSASQLATVKSYIKSQDEHHKIKTFQEEYDSWAKAYGIFDDI